MLGCFGVGPRDLGLETRPAKIFGQRRGRLSSKRLLVVQQALDYSDPNAMQPQSTIRMATKCKVVELFRFPGGVAYWYYWCRWCEKDRESPDRESILGA